MRIMSLLMAGSSLLVSGAALAQSAAPAAAQAQPEASSADNFAPEDIVVTARRREEKLQDVPLAVTAINNAGIERQGVQGLQDVRRLSPSLNISQSAGGGRQIPLITIRGQRQGDTLATVDPSVGVYFGDVLFKRAFGLEQVTFDLNTIEVLKGPQGTLFGLNTTGGNIIFRPNLPTDNLEASVMVGVGNYDYRTIEGYLNVPLGEKAAFRIAGQYKKRDGYIRDVNSNQRFQDLDGGGLRAALKLNPTDDFESVFVGNYLRASTGGTGWKLNSLQTTGQTLNITTGRYVDNTTPTSIFGAGTTYPREQISASLAQNQALGFYQTAYSGKAYAKTNPAWNVANTSSYQLNDDISIKNIIGYRKYKTDYVDEVDGSSLNLLEYGNTQRGKEFSDELQLSGQTDTLNWIVGAYYQRENVDETSYTTGLISPRLLGLKTPYRGIENPTNTSKSIFASGTQKMDSVVEGLSVTLGGRYTKDTREVQSGVINAIGYTRGQPTGTTAFPGPAPSPGQFCAFNPVTDPAVANFGFNPATCLVNLKTSFSRFTYTGTVDWKIAPGKLVYFAHRKGYRAGGFNGRAETSAQFVPFKPETVFDFELGTKLDFRFDNGMFFRTNAAIYKQNYKDVQRLTPFVTATGGVSTNVINAAKATIKGFEIESTFIPTPWLELGGYVSHVDPQYDQFIVQAKNPAGATVNVNVADSATFAGSPRWQIGGSARVNLPTPENVGKLAVQLNYYHQTTFAVQDTADYQPNGQTPGYSLLNGRVELNDVAGMPLRAAFFVNNITKEKYFVANYALQYSFGFTSSLAGAPRMYGLELRYTFGK